MYRLYIKSKKKPYKNTKADQIFENWYLSRFRTTPLTCDIDKLMKMSLILGTRNLKVTHIRLDNILIAIMKIWAIMNILSGAILMIVMFRLDLNNDINEIMTIPSEILKSFTHIIWLVLFFSFTFFQFGCL